MFVWTVISKVILKPLAIYLCSKFLCFIFGQSVIHIFSDALLVLDLALSLSACFIPTCSHSTPAFLSTSLAHSTWPGISFICSSGSSQDSASGSIHLASD